MCMPNNERKMLPPRPAACYAVTFIFFEDQKNKIRQLEPTFVVKMPPFWECLIFLKWFYRFITSIWSNFHFNLFSRSPDTSNRWRNSNPLYIAVFLYQPNVLAFQPKALLVIVLVSDIMLIKSDSGIKKMRMFSSFLFFMLKHSKTITHNKK